MVRFLVTADWQLGMTRAFLGEDAQARFSEARMDAITRLGEIAVSEECDFIVVAGDVFESNQVGLRTQERALERLRALSVPVFLLPGNHDPLDPSSLWGEKRLGRRLPDHVRVLADDRPVSVAIGVELVGAPWRTKNPAADPTLEVIGGLAPAPAGTTRILVGHGAVDALVPSGSDERAPIALAALERGLADGRYHFVALGDRHSLTRVGESGRIFYPGTPEPTRFTETDPGHAIVVSIGDSGRDVDVREVAVGRWRFVQHEAVLYGETEVADLRAWMDGLGAADRVVARLVLSGRLPLVARAELERWLDRRRDALAAIELDAKGLGTTLTPEDIDELELEGLALETANELRDRAAGDGPEAIAAQDALCLLAQLVEDAA